MFDRLFDLIADAWEWLIPWVIIDVYELGVVLRWGMPKRVIGGGLHFVWPLGIEVVKYDTVVRQTSPLDVQSVTSLDDKPVTIAGIIIFTIENIKRFLLEIDDGEADMNNIVYGIITEFVETTNWLEIKTPEFNERVFAEVKRQCNEYCGVNVLAIKWSDKAIARNIRLWNE
jgi:regulator of protease activity HflC (stomatin/prohibitin superfamily)